MLKVAVEKVEGIGIVVVILLAMSLGIMAIAAQKLIPYVRSNLMNWAFMI